MTVVHLPKPDLCRVSLREELAGERDAARRHLAALAERYPMTAEQRRILVMALGVLEMLEGGAS